jgi:hypothetical protein
MTRRRLPELILLEPDYQYGVGSLRIRVEQIDREHPIVDGGKIWYPVKGIQLAANGRELGLRAVYVRGSRLPG